MKFIDRVRVIEEDKPPQVVELEIVVDRKGGKTARYNGQDLTVTFDTATDQYVGRPTQPARPVYFIVAAGVPEPSRARLLVEAEVARRRGDTDLYDALCGLAAKAPDPFDQLEIIPGTGPVVYYSNEFTLEPQPEPYDPKVG